MFNGKSNNDSGNAYTILKLKTKLHARIAMAQRLPFSQCLIAHIFIFSLTNMTFVFGENNKNRYIREV